MQPLDVVQAFVREMEERSLGRMSSLMAVNFVLQGPFSKMLNKDEALDSYKHLVDAFPDCSFHASDARETQNMVNITFRFSGTHTSPLTIPALRIGPVQPAGIFLTLPPAHADCVVRGNFISLISLGDDVPGGGLTSIFNMLGLIQRGA